MPMATAEKSDTGINMFRIAIIDDVREQAETISNYAKKYFSDRKEVCSVQIFSDGMDFISDYKGGFDLVLMDIAMPHMNGMETARRLREIDRSVCLIFITTFVQYAINGYEVNAFDFWIKPVNYKLFSLKMDRVLDMPGRLRTTTFAVRSEGVMRMVPFNEIKYVESSKHYLFFHTAMEELKMRGTIEEIKQLFCKNGFSRINRSLLVNLAYVEGYSRKEVTVAGEQLPLSRVYRADFLNELTEFVGGKRR